MCELTHVSESRHTSGVMVSIKQDFWGDLHVKLSAQKHRGPLNYHDPPQRRLTLAPLFL